MSHPLDDGQFSPIDVQKLRLDGAKLTNRKQVVTIGGNKTVTNAKFGVWLAVDASTYFTTSKNHLGKKSSPKIAH